MKQFSVFLISKVALFVSASHCDTLSSDHHELIALLIPTAATLKNQCNVLWVFSLSFILSFYPRNEHGGHPLG
jgi:hypothetical protein